MFLEALGPKSAPIPLVFLNFYSYDFYLKKDRITSDKVKVYFAFMDF